jgi:hypothetical protein
MTIAAIYASTMKDGSVHYRYVCSWACAEKITMRSRTKPQFEDGYELEQETLCSHCGKRIRATIEE